MEELGRHADHAQCTGNAARANAERELAMLKGQLAAFSAASKWYADPKNLKPC